MNILKTTTLVIFLKDIRDSKTIINLRKNLMMKPVLELLKPDCESNKNSWNKSSYTTWKNYIKNMMLFSLAMMTKGKIVVAMKASLENNPKNLSMNQE